MRIHLRADSVNPAHASFTVFMNGANCGQLTMNLTEAVVFHNFIASEALRTITPFEESGPWDLIKSMALEASRHERV